MMWWKASILLQRGYKALVGAGTSREKVEELNKWKLPEGVKIKTFYDRTALIHTTVETVTDILISGMVLGLSHPLRVPWPFARVASLWR